MNLKQKQQLVALFRYVPIILSLICMVVFLLTRDEWSVDAILQYSPESTLLAALMMFVLYAAKSISIVFPMMVLQIAGGHLFSVPVAMAVNLLGMFILLTLPYWVGYFSGAELVQKLMRKYPKLKTAVEYQQQDSLFVTFFLRVISILPGDIVSMYFGAVKTPFWIYLLGSSLGTAPGVITSTFIGSSLTEPSSPMFIFSLLLTILLSVVSWMLHYFHRKNKAT